MKFEDFLHNWNAGERVATDDVLSLFLPLARAVLEAHRAGWVAPLEGLQDLNVNENRIWFEAARRQPQRQNSAEVARLERTAWTPLEVLAEARRITDIAEGEEKLTRLDIGERGAPVTRPVYLTGYVAWEHEIQHHDPLTDIFSLGMLLASLACQLNLNEPANLESFVARRRNLFALNAQLHPAVTQAIFRMTELDRHRRAQDLPALVESLENYRDQTVPLDLDLARLPGLRTRDPGTRQQMVLSKLRDRLFDISRRNKLLDFRPTMQSVNLTQASIPLLLDVRNIPADRVLVWNDGLGEQIAAGKSISLNKHLNFSEALYLPSLLERLIADARRDQHEFGFVQLRLVACFLTWSNLKEKPVERFVSPLVLLPVRLVKSKGIRDTYSLEPLSHEAEVNPVLRHQFRQLYNIDLPEFIDLGTSRLAALFELLSAKIKASEPAVTLNLIDRPRIDLIHEKARRRLDHYRRGARVAGRGVRHFGNLDYSYDPANYHPLGIKLFSTRVRAPSSHLRGIIEEQPRPRTYLAAEAEPPVVEAEKSFFQLRDATEDNPYLWNFDLCNLTLANFRYRRMSLVRDYESILQDERPHGAFQATFSFEPRPVERELASPPALDDRFDVVPSDPTQATAIAEARQGKSYIIQGPPGTGKSQTITNLIADFVARGKRVLFVCEKRAAIDVVFARLRQAGLGSLCSLIHDSQTDKKEFVLDLKQTYERFLEDPLGKAQDDSPRPSAIRRLRGDLAPFERFEAAMEGALPTTSLTLRRFLDRAIRLGDGPAPLPPDEAERLPAYAELWSNAERLTALEGAVQDLDPSGIFARHPLRRLAPAVRRCDRPIDWVSSAAQQALSHFDRFWQLRAQTGIPPEQWTTLRRVRDLLDYMHCAAPLVCHANLELVDPASERSKRFEITAAEIHQAELILETARQETTAWREKLSPSDVRTALEQARAWQGQFWAWLSRGWWRLRSELRRRYNFDSHAVRPNWVQVLTALAREYEAQAAVQQAIGAASAAFHIDGSPQAFQQNVAALRNCLAAGPDWLRRIHAALLKSPKAESFVTRAVAAAEPARGLSDELAKLLIDYDDLELESLRDELRAVRDSTGQTRQVLAVLNELEQLPDSVGAALRRMDWTVPQLEAAVARTTWDRQLLENRELVRFDHRQRAHTARRLETAYDHWLEANAAEVFHGVRKRFLANVRTANLAASQLSPPDREFKRRYGQGRRALEHEFGKSMRHRAIRELVEGDTALVIADLKPIWLMSPLSVSDTLPLATDLFDVVIFDEASQVPLEESVPALFRGQQVVIVGDEMQLPPTDFFAVRQVESEDELAGDGSGQPLGYDLDSDSLLNHAARNLPSTMLGWHYRSRSESLISFSNWAFYDGRLLTVPEHRLPAAAQPVHPVEDRPQSTGLELMLSRPLSFHRLSDAVYDQRRNAKEADYIAQLVAELLKRGAGLSIGIIAFSEAQQSEIESSLNRLAQDDDEFRTLYEAELEREVDGQFVGLLVKNLENIQGDERDIIILSICYGPGPSGKMLMNFGPINKNGGEKRLNVAFSRAKEYMAVVSSILHAAITNDYNDGANCLKSYLRYAEAMSQGDVEGARRVLARISRWQDPAASDSPEEDQVGRQLAQALTAQGFAVDTSVGQSHFRVDLAVRAPGDSAYRLGILVDTVAQYEQFDPLERDMLRPRLLRAFGWRIATVMAKDWYADRQGELSRILALLRGEESDAASATEASDDREEEAPDDPVIQDNAEQMLDCLLVDGGRGRESDNDPAARPDEQAESPQSVKGGGSAPAYSPDGQAGAAADEPPRYFEYRDDKSNKFWEIRVVDCDHTVRYGRIGAAGQSQTKSFPDAAAAKRDAEKLVGEKTRKGYCESPPPQADPPAVSVRG